MRKYLYIILSYLLLFISCKNSTLETNKNQTEFKLEILNKNDYARFYFIDKYEDNEKCIKYIFYFAKSNSGRLYILTNKNIFNFEDNVEFLDDTTKQLLIFTREKESLKNKEIITNFLENTPVPFTTKETNYQTTLTADFETLTVNTVQNFLDYAKEDETKKENETYTYVLYNKNTVEKMKLIYHEYGEWFEVEIL